MSLHRFNEVYFLINHSLIIFYGFFKSKIFKIPQSSFNYKAIQNNLSNASLNIDRLNQYYSNNNYLSSNQFENKNVVFNGLKLF